jgi:hypothetical protein
MDGRAASSPATGEPMKPGDFFLGITEFFSIMLPGAGTVFIALFMVRQVEVPPDHVLHALLALTGPAAWSAFAVCSYALGHIVASAGSRLDPLYDERRRHHGNRALKRWAEACAAGFLEPQHPAAPARPAAARRPAPMSKLVSGLVGVLVSRAWQEPVEGPSDTGVADHAGKAERPLNAYKLARAILGLRAPVLFAEVQRHEADSKFFRSLVIVSAAALVACGAQLCHDGYVVATGRDDLGRLVWGAGYLVFVFLVLQTSFVRYCELRLKATEAAFQGLLVLELLPAGKTVAAPSADAG